MLLLCDTVRAPRVTQRAIKASAQTDKHSSRPPLITRCVIYRARLYNARVETNLYGRTEPYGALLSRRPHN